MTTDRRPPHVIIADAAADRARAADQRQRVSVLVERAGAVRFDPDAIERPTVERRRFAVVERAVAKRSCRKTDAKACYFQSYTVAAIYARDCEADPSWFVADHSCEDVPAFTHAVVDTITSHSGPDSIEHPTILRRRSPAEVRDHHLATIRASLIGLGLTGDAASRLTEEIERLMVEVAP